VLAVKCDSVSARVLSVGQLMPAFKPCAGTGIQPRCFQACRSSTSSVIQWSECWCCTHFLLCS